MKLLDEMTETPLAFLIGVAVVITTGLWFFPGWFQFAGSMIAVALFVKSWFVQRRRNAQWIVCPHCGTRARCTDPTIAAKVMADHLEQFHPVP